jgi:hypothetical protein
MPLDLRTKSMQGRYQQHRMFATETRSGISVVVWVAYAGTISANLLQGSPLYILSNAHTDMHPRVIGTGADRCVLPTRPA